MCFSQSGKALYDHNLYRASWHIGLSAASYAADPGSNPSAGKLTFVWLSDADVQGSKNDCGKIERIVEMLECRLRLTTSQRHVMTMKHESMKHCRNSPIESRIIHKSCIGPGLGQKATSGSSQLKRKDYNMYTYTYTYFTCLFINNHFLGQTLVHRSRRKDLSLNLIKSKCRAKNVSMLGSCSDLSVTYIDGSCAIVM